ncbi:MAG: hypothetical protein R2795_25350 [Saprospiraceae bacterium]
MQTNTTEKGFEAHIANYLATENGYLLRVNTDYDNVNCLDAALLFQYDVWSCKRVDK